MKKFLLTIAVAAVAMFATAQTKTYTDNLSVVINESEPSEQEATISVKKNSDGTYSLSLNKFILGGFMPVGNIVLDNITATENAGIRSFETKQNILIAAGDENAKDWIGPTLGEVPVNLVGEMTDGSLYCIIDINMGTEIVSVTFGKNIKATRNYTDELVVTINNEAAAPQQATINVDEKEDGTYTLSLNNFILGEDVPVGNVVVHNISTTVADGVSNFTTKQNIYIVEGDIDRDDWLAPMLGEVPIDLTGKMTEYKLYCDIDIDMTALLNKVINVKFGNESLSGIENIIGEQSAKAIFDVTGRRIETVTAPGIYIVNGKKVLVK